jgi:hypothetical protein
MALAVTLAGCGNREDNAPTSVPSVVPSLVPTATVQPLPPGPATPVTDAGSETTVGDLADRIAAAWTGVTSYQINTIEFPSDGATPPVLPGASPIASPLAGPTEPSGFWIDEVVLPDLKRRRIVADQVVASEIVVSGGQIYVRGEIVVELVDATLGAETWVVLTAADLATGSPLAQVLEGFLTPAAAPLSAISAEQRSLPMNFVRQTTAENRVCDLYHVVQTTLTGERVDVEIAIDASGLPCLIQTSVGGQTTVATYVAFNTPLTIEPPAEAVPLPAASPTAPASPAAG